MLTPSCFAGIKRPEAGGLKKASWNPVAQDHIWEVQAGERRKPVPRVLGDGRGGSTPQPWHFWGAETGVTSISFMKRHAEADVAWAAALASCWCCPASAPGESLPPLRKTPAESPMTRSLLLPSANSVCWTHLLLHLPWGLPHPYSDPGPAG